MRRQGQDSVEYGLLMATIVVFVLLVISRFGERVAAWLTQVFDHVTHA